MRIMRWLSIMMAMTVIISCFLPWVTLDTHHFRVEGFFSTNNNFGRPGLFHVILCSIFILLVLVGKVWSLRTAFFVGAFNLAWAIRNYVLISACRGGICPEKHAGMYLLLVCSILAIVTLLFADFDKKAAKR